MSQFSEREQMLKKVQQLGFMTDDLRLFLDTHPQCHEALCALLDFLAREKAARRQYENCYGPLTLEAVGGKCRYDWINGPWPWQVEV